MATKIAQAFKHHSIFVTNLKWTTGPKELKQYFEEFGAVTKSVIIFDKDTGLSKGYGFLLFKEEQSVRSAFEKGNHIIEGRQLDIQFKDSN